MSIGERNPAQVYTRLGVKPIINAATLLLSTSNKTRHRGAEDTENQIRCFFGSVPSAPLWQYDRY